MSLAQEFETTKKRGAKAVYKFLNSVNPEDYSLNSNRDLLELHLFAKCLTEQYFDTALEDKVEQIRALNGQESFPILEKAINAVLMVDDHKAIAAWGDFLKNYPEAESLLEYIDVLLDDKIQEHTQCQASLIGEDGEIERYSVYTEKDDNYTGLYPMMITLFTAPDTQLNFSFVTEGVKQIETMILRNNNDEDGVVVVSGELENPNIKIITPNTIERN